MFCTFDFGMCFAPEPRAIFHLSSGQMAPNLQCFQHLHFQKCFAPKRCAPFSIQHLNFQKWSEHGVLWAWADFSILTFKRASRQNGVHLFISHLPTWFRTRRFSKPTFGPSTDTKHWKNTVSRDCSTFSRTCMFFLLTLSLLWYSFFCLSLLWRFRPLLFHLSILSEVWRQNFLRILT